MVSDIRKRLGELRKDTRAQMGTGADEATSLIVGLVVSGLMAAYLLPMVIEEIVDVDTSSWGSGAADIWGLLDIMIVLSIFLFFVGLALSRR